MSANFCSPALIDRFASRLLADTDCQAMGMVERGYAALAQPGGAVSIALTGLMVIAVAFFGYRLLLGRGVLLSDAIGLTVKLGIVLLIATSWQSWQAVAYEGFAQAPTQIASDMLVGIGAPPPIESLETTLDNLTAAAVGYRTRAGIASPLVGGPAAAAATLNISAILLTLSTVGILVAAKVMLAILLAIAPAMAGLFLFNRTRGMAQGWLGAMVSMAIVPAFALLVAAIEFALLTPMIARLLAEQAAGTFETTSVMPIGLVAIVFVIALIFALRSASQIGRGLLHGHLEATNNTSVSKSAEPRVSEREARQAAPATAQPGVSRALESISRRDASPIATVRSILGSSASGAARDSGNAVSANSTTIISPFERRSARLKNRPRRSRSAARRDS